MSLNYVDWSDDQVIEYLKLDLELNSITDDNWKDLGICGNMLDILLGEEGLDLLKNELGVPS